jgi:hypothetical protein
VPPLLSGDLFVITSVSITLHVPSGSISAYSSAVVWRDFRPIVEVSLPVDPPVPPIDPDPIDPSPVPPVDPIVPDDPSSTTSIIPSSSSIKLSLTSVLLSVSSPYSEHITIYSSSGVLLIRASKEKGSTGISIGHLPKGVLIIRGSSGWVHKIIRQ